MIQIVKSIPKKIPNYKFPNATSLEIPQEQEQLKSEENKKKKTLLFSQLYKRIYICIQRNPTQLKKTSETDSWAQNRIGHQAPVHQKKPKNQKFKTENQRISKRTRRSKEPLDEKPIQEIQRAKKRAIFKTLTLSDFGSPRTERKSKSRVSLFLCSTLPCYLIIFSFN